MSYPNATESLPDPLTSLVQEYSYQTLVTNYAGVGSLGVGPLINFSILDLTSVAENTGLRIGDPRQHCWGLSPSQVRAECPFVCILHVQVREELSMVVFLKLK